MSYAWEVTDDDIRTALKNLGVRATQANINRAADLLDYDAVEKAALYGDELDEQAEYALKEIMDQLRGQLRAAR